MVAAQELADYKHNLLSVEPVSWDESWFRGLQKKYRPPKSKAEFSPIATGTPREQIGLALSLLPKVDRERVTHTFTSLGLHTLTNAQLYPALKQLGDLAKHHGDLLFPGFWMHLVDWNLHFGAEPTSSDTAEFEELIKAWIQEAKPEDAADSEREKVIFRGLELLAVKLGTPSGPSATIDEFIDSPSLWLSNGSSDSRKLNGTRSTKFSTYAASTRAQLKRDLRDTSSLKYKIFDKRERGKHRNLISAPWTYFMQMAFVGVAVEDRFKRVVPTSLDKDFGPNNWMDWMNTIRRKLLVPIDQSKFDHVPSMRVMTKAMEVLVKAAIYPGDKDRISIGETIIDRLKHGELDYEGKTYKHQRGLLSGWRWTSLLGTMINYAEYLGIADKLALPRERPQDTCFQGDDSLVAVSDWGLAVKMVNKYMQVLPVNPSKFFIDRSRTEYLRYVLTHTHRKGYFARAAAGLMYANAWAGGALDPASLASTWSLIYSRGGELKSTVQCCVEDLCGLLRCSHTQARDLLQTPASVGGLGWMVPNMKPKKWRRLDTQVERVQVGERLVVATDYELLPKKMQLEMEAFALGRTKSRSMARLQAKSLSTGLVGATERQRPTQSIVDYVGSKTMPYSLAEKHVTPPAPASLLDSIWRTEAIATLDREGGPLWSEVFRSQDVSWLQGRKRNWGYKLFNKWAGGQLAGVPGKRWGDAPDVIGMISKTVTDAGIIPSGRVTTARVQSRLLSLELQSRHIHLEMRQRLGA